MVLADSRDNRKGKGSISMALPLKGEVPETILVVEDDAREVFEIDLVRLALKCWRSVLPKKQYVSKPIFLAPFICYFQMS